MKTRKETKRRRHKREGFYLNYKMRIIMRRRRNSILSSARLAGVKGRGGLNGNKI